jgi:hypothetical protein
MLGEGVQARHVPTPLDFGGGQMILKKIKNVLDIYNKN